MLTQATEKRKTIIRKNKPRTYLVDISANVSQRKATAICPLEERWRGTMGPSQHKSRGKDNIVSDLENKLFFGGVFREKVNAKYDSYKNFLSQSGFE